MWGEAGEPCGRPRTPGIRYGYVIRQPGPVSGIYAKRKERFSTDVHAVPQEIDSEVGRLKLLAMGITIDSLTEEQRQYLESWQQGT